MHIHYPFGACHIGTLLCARTTASSNADDIADRRPVDPTPIIQLKVIDGNGDDLAVEDGEKKGRLRRPEPGPSGMTFMQSKLSLTHA